MRLREILLVILMVLPIVSADIIAPSPTEIGLISLLLIAINFVINAVIIYILLASFKKFVRKEKINKILRILFITLIGFAIDAVALLSFTGGRSYLLTTLSIGIFVFIFVSLTSYFLLFRKALVNKWAFLSSGIFGLISNPVWFWIFY